MAEKHRKGVATGFFCKGSGSVVRESLQQLEKAGYVKKFKKGRQVTPEGQAYLDGVAHRIRSKMQVEAAPAAPAAAPAAEPAA